MNFVQVIKILSIAILLDIAANLILVWLPYLDTSRHDAVYMYYYAYFYFPISKLLYLFIFVTVILGGVERITNSGAIGKMFLIAVPLTILASLPLFGRASWRGTGWW